MNKKILVIGGAGFIGSIVNKMLLKAGYDTVVFDNLSCGDHKSIVKGKFVYGDMADLEALDRLFKNHTFDAVMHFAAWIDVGESILEPAKYYRNNVVNTLNLLETMLRYRVKTFIFSSSAAIFGIPLSTPITEEMPTNPINPYGESKLMVEKILRDLDVAHELRYCCLRYFNAAGADPDNEIKIFKKKETNLIPIALRSLIVPRGKITIFGTDYPTHDGTCIRDYIHVYDLGTAHIKAMENIFAGAKSTSYNLGNGYGYSVREVLQTIENVTGLKLDWVEGMRRPGDPPILVADAQKAQKELHWQTRYPDLESMISHAWNALDSTLFK